MLSLAKGSWVHLRDKNGCIIYFSVRHLLQIRSGRAGHKRYSLTMHTISYHICQSSRGLTYSTFHIQLLQYCYAARMGKGQGKMLEMSVEEPIRLTISTVMPSGCSLAAKAFIHMVPFALLVNITLHEICFFSPAWTIS